MADTPLIDYGNRCPIPSSTSQFLIPYFNIRVILKLQGHASIQATMNSFASVVEYLIMNNVHMIIEKFNDTR